MSGPAAERANAPPAPHKRAPPVVRSAAVRQALGRGPIQRAAVIGRPDDACEREAERIARSIANRPDAPVQATDPAAADRIQRAPLPELDEGERPGEYLVQPARLATASDPPPVPPGFDARLVCLRGGGRPLAAPLRTGMEATLGEPFDAVRIHDGPEAAELAASVAARAFTTGDDIVFGAGRFDPQGSEGRALIAHELTHVVQQRGPRPGGAVAEPAPPVVQREELGLLDRAALAVVEEVAPRIAPLIERGPVQWLRDQLAAAFDGIVGAFARLNLGGIVEELILVFGVMLDRATAIAQALVSGDCAPLFAALAQLRDFVTEVAGRAWDRLTTLLQPIADFFTDLWDSIGAPAIQWLQEFAGDLWQLIQDLGAYLWSKVEPIKDALSAAWDWVKEQLFGPADAAEGDSQSGIIGWLTRKATEAWDWVKEQTRPVWEPVAQAVETVRSLIPPAFVAELGERMTALGGEVGAAADATGGGASVAENRAALAGILPSVSQLLAMVRERLVAAGQWLVTTVGGVAAQVATFFGRLRASSILGALAAGLGWLETAIARLAAWATERVAGLFTWLVTGFDALTPFLQRLIETVGNVIAVAGDLLRLPQLVLGAIWNLIPECIRTPITTFLTEQILARIPIFNQLTQIGALWSRLQATALSILRQAFVDGDLARAAWTFFSTMLDLIGLPAQLVVQILAKAAAAIGQILRDPVGFLINLLRALRDGFARFFGNILTHLMNGIAGWLFGRLGEAGITPPIDLSLRGILGFVMQILDITVERVLERLGRRIGPERVARIRQVLSAATGVWEFVRVLIEEGPAGLWRLLQQRLSNLWSLVLDSVVGWVSTRVIAAATQWLLSLLDPTAIMAVITSAIALYRAIESFVQYLREMLEIVSRVLDGILGIASGAIEAAAGFLENAMARTLPVAIGFLANQVGLGGLSTRIREFVEGVRARVDAALDWIIDRAIRAGQAFLALLQRGVGAVQRGVAAIREWWRARKAFRAQDGTEHSVYIAGQGATARLMVESEPETYVRFIESRPASADKTEALDLARQLDAAIAAAARDPAATAPAPPGSQAPTNHATIIQGLLDELATVTARLMPADATGPSTPPIYGGQVQGFGTVATVARLTKKGLPQGGSPTVSSESWDRLRRRKGDNRTYYVRGHLLNDNIGGPGNTWSNLTPLTQNANNSSAGSHLHGFETQVKQAVLEGRPTATPRVDPRAVSFVCTATYGRPSRETQAQRFEGIGGENNRLIAAIIREETKVPLALDCSARELDPQGAPGVEVWPFRVDNPIDTSDSSYEIFEGATPTVTIYVNEVPEQELTTRLTALRGIGPATVAKIDAGRPFTRHADLDAAVGTRYANILRNEFNVRLTQRGGTEA